jgi:hypothetical protein
MPFAPCEALLRSGTRCRSATLSDSSFCAHHSDLVKHIGEERVRNGDRPRRRKATVPEPLVAEADTAPVTRNGADPAQVRPRLAEAAAASLTCRNCSQKERIEDQVPDVRSRVAAIELLLREGLGRPPQADDASAPRLPRTAEAVEKLGWDDMRAIFASTFVTEIEAVTERGGEALVLERVASLDDGQRELLRKALTS